MKKMVMTLKKHGESGPSPAPTNSASSAQPATGSAFQLAHETERTTHHPVIKKTNKSKRTDQPSSPTHCSKKFRSSTDQPDLDMSTLQITASLGSSVESVLEAKGKLSYQVLKESCTLKDKEMMEKMESKELVYQLAEHQSKASAILGEILSSLDDGQLSELTTLKKHNKALESELSSLKAEFEAERLSLNTRNIKLEKELAELKEEHNKVVNELASLKENVKPAGISEGIQTCHSPSLGHMFLDMAREQPLAAFWNSALFLSKVAPVALNYYKNSSQQISEQIRYPDFKETLNSEHPVEKLPDLPDWEGIEAYMFDLANETYITGLDSASVPALTASLVPAAIPPAT